MQTRESVPGLGILAILLLCGLLSSPALAQNPFDRLTQYAHTAWRIQDGAFDGAPNAISQTKDGYLWIGTDSGLIQFDGVRFTPRTDFPGSAGFKSVFSLAAGKDGSLWIGTWTGAFRLHNGKFENPHPARIGRVNGILEGRDGSIWMARTRIRDGGGPLCRLKGDDFHCYGAADGLACKSGQTLAMGVAGDIWIGSSPGVCRWSAGSSAIFLPPGAREGQENTSVETLSSGGDGGMFVGYTASNPQIGLTEIISNRWGSPQLAELRNFPMEITAVLVDRGGATWIGTARQGIYHVVKGVADHFAAVDGLSNDNVTGLYQDHEGSVWVTTPSGLDRFHPLKVVSLTTREGAVSNTIDAVLTRRDGSIVMGGVGGLTTLKNGQLSVVRFGHLMPSGLVTSLLEDHKGSLFVGIDDGLAIFADGKFEPIAFPAGTGLRQRVSAIIEDPQNQVWIIAGTGRDPHLFHLHGRRLEAVSTPEDAAGRAIYADPTDGFWLQLLSGDVARYKNGQFQVIKRPGPDYDFNDFIVDADHALWAWGGQGLLRWQNGTWEKLSARNGLPCDTIYNFSDDGKGLWWLYMSCGIAVLSKAELDRWSAHTDGVTITPTRFLTFADGAHGALNDLRANSALSRDGRIWFANSAPIQTIDTEHLPINTVPPPVLIEQIIADRSPHRAQASLSLPALTRDLEIDYTALSLVEPQNVRFRYKIAGIDKGWQDVGSRRQAFYMNLGPGRYVFRVIASNNDGVWNEAGDTLEFRILPMFYQTRWFFVLCLAATASLVWIVYLYRVRQVTARLNMRFQERIAERNRIAGELHDTLLQSVQGLILHFQRARNLFSTNPSEAVQRLDVALERAEEAIVEGRNAIHDIRSSNLIETDLEQAFSALGEELIPANQSSQALKIVTEGAAKPLNPAVRDEIYRIVREAMRNAFTHSKSQNIEVEIMYEEKLFRVRIRDDGKGIDPAVVDQVSPSGHWGLVGMRERAKRMGGELDVWSEDKAGTEIELTLPGAIAYETTPSDAGFRLFRKRTNHAR